MSESTLTAEDIRDESANGDVHIIMLATGYRLYYEGTAYPGYPVKAEAVAAAHALAADHNNEHGAFSCNLVDWTAVPITEEDKPR